MGGGHSKQYNRYTFPVRSSNLEMLPQGNTQKIFPGMCLISPTPLLSQATSAHWQGRQSLLSTSVFARISRVRHFCQSAQILHCCPKATFQSTFPRMFFISPYPFNPTYNHRRRERVQGHATHFSRPSIMRKPHG